MEKFQRCFRRDSVNGSSYVFSYKVMVVLTVKTVRKCRIVSECKAAR